MLFKLYSNSPKVPRVTLIDIVEILLVNSPSDTENVKLSSPRNIWSDMYVA